MYGLENSFLSDHAGFDMMNWFSGRLDRGKAFTDVRPLQVFCWFCDGYFELFLQFFFANGLRLWKMVFLGYVFSDLYILFSLMLFCEYVPLFSLCCNITVLLSSLALQARNKSLGISLSILHYCPLSLPLFFFYAIILTGYIS